MCIPSSHLFWVSVYDLRVSARTSRVHTEEAKQPTAEQQHVSQMYLRLTLGPSQLHSFLLCLYRLLHVKKKRSGILCLICTRILPYEAASSAGTRKHHLAVNAERCEYIGVLLLQVPFCMFHVKGVQIYKKYTRTDISNVLTYSSVHMHDVGSTMIAACQTSCLYHTQHYSRMYYSYELQLYSCNMLPVIRKTKNYLVSVICNRCCAYYTSAHV